MPSDDKKGLPSIFPSRRDILKGAGSSVVQSIAHPLVEASMKHVLSGPTSTVSSIADKLPMTRNLLKELYNLEYKLDKVMHSLRKNKEDLILDNQGEGGQYLRQFVNDLQYDIRNRETIKRSLKNPHELTKVSVTDLNEELEKINASIEDKFYIMEGMSKTQKKAVKEILNLKAQMNTVRVIAKDKQVPLNFFKDKIYELEETYLGDVVGGEIMGEPWHQVLKEDREYMLDDVFNNPNNLAELESIQEEYLLMDTPEYFESLKNDIQNNRIDVDDFKDSSVFMDLQDVISNPNASLQQKEEAYKLAVQNIIALRKRMSEFDIFSNEIYNDMRSFSDLEFDDPDKKQIILKTFQDEFKNASKIIAKNLAKDYVKGKFVTKGGFEDQEYKAGPWSQKIYDYLKNLKTSKAPSGPTIESDKTRAEKAKEVKEVKDKKPIRNIKDDLRLAGKVVRGIPLMLSGDVNQEELLRHQRKLAAEQMADTEMQVDRGRVNRDPYKTYGRQRAI